MCIGVEKCSSRDKTAVFSLGGIEILPKWKIFLIYPGKLSPNPTAPSCAVLWCFPPNLLFLAFAPKSALHHLLCCSRWVWLRDGSRLPGWAGGIPWLHDFRIYTTNVATPSFSPGNCLLCRLKDPPSIQMRHRRSSRVFVARHELAPAKRSGRFASKLPSFY